LDDVLMSADSTRPLQLRLLPKDANGPAARIVLLAPALGLAR
jgi:hypothetical protein